jgi:alkylhydroperoxidase family enzyme
MSRIPPVPLADAPDDVRRVYQAVAEKFGQVPTPIAVSARHPDVFRAYTACEGAFARAARVDAKLKMLALVKAAALVGCPF